jgi:DNA-binding transcriptional LysR family regulator
VDWDDFRYVLASTRHGSLSGAATSLGVTRTTVGRRLRAMESAMGVRLFDRTPSGLVPTMAGQDMATLAEKMEADVHALERRVLGRDVQLAGKLRVSTLDLQFHCFQASFASFAVRYPRVELTVSMSSRAVSLTQREADVALRVTRAPPEHLFGRRIADVRYAVYAGEGLAERIGPDAPLHAFPWLQLDERLGARWMVRWMAAHAPGAAVAMRLDSGVAIAEGIRAGIGVHLLPTYVGDPMTRVVRVGPIFDDPHGLWLLTSPELKRTSRVRAFMDHMSGAISAHLKALELPS